MQFLSENYLGVQKDLARLIELGADSFKITGTDSGLVLAGLIGAMASKGAKRSVMVASSPKEVQRLARSLQSVHTSQVLKVLPEFDVWPASGLYPSPQLTAARVGWCARILNEEPGLYLATARSLAQWTMPQEVLMSQIHHWSRGNDLPSELPEFLKELGYRAVPFVEDYGQYSLRGSILDLFCPYYDRPLRFELFGDTIESLRRFDPATQRSVATMESCYVTPCFEITWDPEHRMGAAQRFKSDLQKRQLEDSSDAQAYLQSLAQGRSFPGLEYLTAFFYENPERPFDFLDASAPTVLVQPHEVVQTLDESLAQLREEHRAHLEIPLNIEPEHILSAVDFQKDLKGQPLITYAAVDILSGAPDDEESPKHLQVAGSTQKPAPLEPRNLAELLHSEVEQGYTVFFSLPSESQRQLLSSLWSEDELLNQKWEESFPESWAEAAEQKVYLTSKELPESLRLNQDRVLFLRGQDFFPRRRAAKKSAQVATETLSALSFQDLKVGDNVVHTLHGVGVFEGMKVMSLQGVETEYLELRYKDNDRLYLPIYRLNQLHKYGGAKTKVLDKLGGPGWERTKSKVKKRLREMADELLKLYSLRQTAQRPPIQGSPEDFQKFVAEFPFEETPDQLQAMEDILGDFSKSTPMDRLICGDVGFGKTEIAMRAAFQVAAEGKQVAVLAPTTILTFQHFENFKARFKNWPLKIGLLNRFVSPKESRATLEQLSRGELDIVIGTHRLFNSSVKFHDLGLLIVDEEQKFGVAHKEKLRRLRTHVDTLSMSATPLPRTLNMSFIGMRDLSMINTAPVDRLPTRTFVTQFDPETVRRAIASEVERGGQVFYLHNRVQSIHSVASELRELLPNLRLAVAHGQMEEKSLEKTMVDFFHREVDVLVCTTIIEAGMDVPNANTMFIDDAHRFGLSQLYQLRGRVGRSKKRAYCYLLIPKGRTLEKDAQERLRVIQENTALGSGLVIAQYDLELRGAGTLLGEEQSGHIDSVGYEMFLELMEEAMQEAKGETPEEKLNPEINIRIPALIPSTYVPDLRVRLSLYRRLSLVKGAEDLDQIEDDLRDQFGPIPQEVLNLMGIMLISALCRELGVKEVTSGLKSVSLAFSESTKLNPTDVVELALKQPKRYSLTPDNRLVVRTDPKDWPRILDELVSLRSLLSRPDTFVQH